MLDLLPLVQRLPYCPGLLQNAFVFKFDEPLHTDTIDATCEQRHLPSSASVDHPPEARFARARVDNQGRRFPQSIAHRGYKSKYAENTIQSFEEAIKAGAHALETDLHLSQDGVVVLSHVCIFVAKVSFITNYKLRRTPTCGEVSRLTDGFRIATGNGSAVSRRYLKIHSRWQVCLTCSSFLCKVKRMISGFC
jgi:glycerophosphoryl diester phosphodiesterase